MLLPSCLILTPERLIQFMFSFKKTTLTLKVIFACTTIFLSSLAHAASLPSLLNQQNETIFDHVSMDNATDYMRFMHQHDIYIGNIDSRGIPAVYCKNLPNDLHDLNTPEKKKAFIMIMLPLIKKVNREIKKTRSELIKLHNQKLEDKSLSDDESEWLDDVYVQYNVSLGDFNHLLSRVNIVPASLVLAQSIDESGWGTSYTAKHGNAIFGQHESPLHESYVIRADHGRVRLAGFNTLYESVYSYIHNLNINPAYQDFRLRRQQMQNSDELLLGYSLANSLVHYSSRGRHYIQDLHELMRNADLNQFDNIKLAKNQPVHVTFSER
ncbi:MAG: glucosaminidase domain-containing protein [Plesiomonas sp.]|uniref:glucosaminidase domain-containing protein n=1 Tax=Plesiomonas sp. TaxID=2486279 RepID=UPI003F398299